MKIACPNCDTKYALNADALGTHGRKMKCAKCTHVWVALPRDAEEAIAPVIVSPTLHSEPDQTSDQVEGFPKRAQLETVGQNTDIISEVVSDQPKIRDEELWDEDLIEEQAAEAAQAAADGSQSSFGERSTKSRFGRFSVGKIKLQQVLASLKSIAIIGWQKFVHAFKWAAGLSLAYQVAVLIALAMPLILVSGLFAGRQIIVRQFPDLASLYTMVGVDVNLYGLTFEGVRTVRRPENGVAVLVVEGHVRNITDTTRRVPRLHFILSGRNREVYTWQDDASPHPLQAGETVRFRTVVASPPDVADELHVRFYDNDPQLNRL